MVFNFLGLSGYTITSYSVVFKGLTTITKTSGATISGNSMTLNLSSAEIGSLGSRVIIRIEFITNTVSIVRSDKIPMYISGGNAYFPKSVSLDRTSELIQNTANDIEVFKDELVSNELFGYLPGTQSSSQSVSKTPIIAIPRVHYSVIDPTADNSTYFKELIKWICQKYPNYGAPIFIGVGNPNSQGVFICNIYDTNDVNSNGYPRYASGICYNLGTFLRFSFYDFNWSISTI